MCVCEIKVTITPRKTRNSNKMAAQPPVAMTQEQLTNLIISLQSQIQRNSASSPSINSDVKTGNFVKCSARFDGKPESDVEAFIDSVEIFKDCASVSDENALRGLPMLLDGIAATWWQGMKPTTVTWKDAIQALRDAYSSKKQPYQIYVDLFSMEHDLSMTTDAFVCRARALLSHIPDKLSEKVQIDMIFGLINRKIRKRVPRNSVSTFRDLLDAARTVEESLKEAAKKQTSKDVETKMEQKPIKEKSKCKYCKKVGHSIEECRKKKKAEKENTPETKEPSENKETVLKCYGCGNPGFIRSKCPKCQGEQMSANALEFCKITQSSNLQSRPVLKIRVKGARGMAFADSGAQVSVAGRSLYNILQREGSQFTKGVAQVAYADGIHRSEEILRTTVDVELEGRKIPTNFLIFPKYRDNKTLLGIDFLETANIVINVGQKSWSFGDDPEKYYLYELESQVQQQADVAKVEVTSVSLRSDEGTHLTQQQHEELNKLLEENQSVFAPGGEATSFAEHEINTGDHSPIYVPPYKVPAGKKQVLKEEIDKLIQDGIIEECESPWGAPIVLVEKEGGGVRLCVDYRKMNAITVSDGYPMPRIDELLHDAKITPFMTTIDLRSGYHQVSVKKEHRDKTCFVTPYGTYRYLRMPFGLRNAPATFQRLMDRFKSGLSGVSIFAYLDDIIVLSETFEKHLSDLNRVFNRLKLFGLRGKREKCRFACVEVRYLGHLITTEGIQVNPDKVSAIMKIPSPKNQKQVQSFLQTCSWYRKFIENFSAVAKPLCTLTKRDAIWKWGEEEENSFQKLKENLTKAPILQQADYSKPYVLRTDASGYALGAVLLQGEGTDERPIEYASRLLTTAESNYSTTEREALAVVWAIEKFRGYLEGAKVIIGTDHQPLKWLLSLKTPSGRLARWALKLQAYDLQISYTPGSQNVVADMLSRPPIANEVQEKQDVLFTTIVMPRKSSTEMREEQLSDPEVKKIIDAFEADEPVNISRWTDRGYILTNGVLYRYSPVAEDEEPQLVIPTNCRKLVMEEYHDASTAGHYGVEKTLSRISSRYYFTGMRKYVEEYLKQCPECQKYKVSNLKPAGLLQTPAATQRFETIAVDLVGPLPETETGLRWILTVEDTASKWIEIFPLKEATASNCAYTLINEIFLRYGTPRKMISDNGVQFISDVMQQVTHTLGISQSLIPLYHPESNPIERRHRDLTTQLSILVKDKHRNWSDHLPAIKFAMNTAKCVSTGFTPAYLTFGRELRTPDDVNHDLRHIVEEDKFIPAITPYLKRFAATLQQARENIEKQQDIQKTRVDDARRPATFELGDKVLIRSHHLSNASKGLSAKLAPRRDGPYRIRRVVTPTTYEVEELGEGREYIGKFHTNDLFKFQERQSEAPPQPILPHRRRGRPRKTQPTSKDSGRRTRSSAVDQRGRV